MWKPFSLLDANFTAMRSYEAMGFLANEATYQHIKISRINWASFNQFLTYYKCNYSLLKVMQFTSLPF